MTPETTQAFGLDPTAFWATVIASVLVVTLALEQAHRFWGLVAGARDLGAEVAKVLHHGDLQAARTVCERSASPVADILIAALNRASRPGASMQRAAERERQRFGLQLRRRLWALGSVAALSPFVGLFGTVVGIIRAFRDIAAAGTGGFDVVAGGVSHALQATAGGILVAILAVLLYNFFQTRGNLAAVEVKLVVDEFLENLGAVVAARAEAAPAPNPEA
jgi:biopolymer transport protein ExbB/TolQ